MHGLADGEWDEVVLGAPDDEGGLGDVSRRSSSRLSPDSSGVEAHLDDLAAGGDLAQHGSDDEGGQCLGRVRREHVDEAVEAVGVGGDEGVAREGGLVGDAGAVVEDEAIDHRGVVEGELGGDPSAHGPAADVGVGEVAWSA